MGSSQASRKNAKEELVHVGIKVRPELKEKWEALAEENGRNISEWCWRQIVNLNKEPPPGSVRFVKLAWTKC
jgi:hypothetical protein